MHKFFISVLIIGMMAGIVLPSCSSRQKNMSQQESMEITVTGMADHSKAGAIVTTNENTYFIEGKSNWNNDSLYQKKVRVTGTLKKVTTPEKDLKNEKGEYTQGMPAETLYLVNARWEEVK